jgi:hypothetical protein
LGFVRAGAQWRGTAGRTAGEGYVEARRAVRRRRVEVVVSLTVAVLAAALAVLTARGRSGPFTAAAPVLVGIGVVATAVACLRRPRPDPERWLRGAAGEVATAEILDGLGRRRWAVLHDRRLPGSRANVDHLVIGPRGVWVVDSKAFRAPVRAGWHRVDVGGRRLEVDAVQWEASVVADRLGLEVRPLVVVHGLGLPRRGRRCDGVRVLPAASLLRHLRRHGTGARLGRADVREVARRAHAALPEA